MSTDVAGGWKAGVVDVTAGETTAGFTIHVDIGGVTILAAAVLATT